MASGSASFGFSASEAGSTFRCSLDGAAYGACTSPAAYSGLADGSHTFAVYAVDAAGNADATPATRTWTVDTVAPAAPVITGPADGSVNGTGTVVVSGTAEPGSTVAVSDGTTQRGTGTVSGDGSWSVTLTGVADGAHSYTARATDAAGNVSAVSAAVGVTVDTTAPDTRIDSGPSGTVTSGSASFGFSSTKTGSTFQCSLDGAAYAACTSPRSYSALAEGGHSFAVYAVDSLGHVDATPATGTWTVNATIVNDGFEGGAFAPTVWTVKTGGDGTAAVQTDVVKTGVYAARFAETANTGSLAYARAPFPVQNDLLVSGDFKILTEGVSGANVPLLRLFDSTGTRIVSVYRQNLAGDKLYVQYGGTSYLATKTLPLNTWAHLDLHVTAAGTGVSVIELKLNGTSVYSTTVGTLSTGVAAVQVGNETAKQTFALVADNITAVVPG
jgi:Bacterial Ig-like domain